MTCSALTRGPPTTLMSDRGAGMYAPSGPVTRAYDRAARDCGFKFFWEAGCQNAIARYAGLAPARDRSFLGPWRAQETYSCCCAMEGAAGAMVENDDGRSGRG